MKFDTDATQEFLDGLPHIEPGQRFRFACHPGVPCFNACCSNLTLVLTPYDALRLRRHLGLASTEFVNRHATLLVAPDTGFPVLRLRMLEDEKKSCPFVSEAGCTIYPDRPGACRIYPLGRAVRTGEAGDIREHFFLIEEPHCKGFAEDHYWDADEWFGDQGLVAYNRMNDRLVSLIDRRRAQGQPLHTKQTSMALLALYQPDSFQEFIRRMNLFSRVEVSEERQARILADEEATLEFGLDWLELILLGRSDSLRQRS